MLRQERPNGSGVGADEIHLQCRQFVGRNCNVRQLPESGGDPIDDRVARHDVGDDPQRCQHARPGSVGQRDGRPAFGYGSDSIQRERPAVNLDIHGSQSQGIEPAC